MHSKLCYNTIDIYIIITYDIFIYLADLSISSDLVSLETDSKYLKCLDLLESILVHICQAQLSKKNLLSWLKTLISLLSMISWLRQSLILLICALRKRNACVPIFFKDLVMVGHDQSSIARNDILFWVCDRFISGLTAFRPFPSEKTPSATIQGLRLLLNYTIHILSYFLSYHTNYFNK